MTIEAKVITDSISPHGIRLTTMQLRYPKFIHGEFMTHRVFSRNASSSRAIPVERMIEDIERDPAMPVYWGKNQKGMQAREENDALVSIGHLLPSFADVNEVSAEQAWIAGLSYAVQLAQEFANAGYHKQIVNRLLEPFAHINVVVTATEWANFYALRRHPDAQPEMKALADAMWEAQQASEPVKLHPGQWHLPYITLEDRETVWLDEFGGNQGGDPNAEEEANRMLIKISVARCARVSYLTHEGKTPTIEEDLALSDRLVGAHPMHASPAEHQATPDTQWEHGPYLMGWEQPHLHGNFRGWVQYRKTLPGECVS